MWIALPLMNKFGLVLILRVNNMVSAFLGFEVHLSNICQFSDFVQVIFSHSFLEQGETHGILHGVTERGRHYCILCLLSALGTPTINLQAPSHPRVIHRQPVILLKYLHRTNKDIDIVLTDVRYKWLCFVRRAQVQNHRKQDCQTFYFQGTFTKMVIR